MDKRKIKHTELNKDWVESIVVGEIVFKYAIHCYKCLFTALWRKIKRRVVNEKEVGDKKTK